MKKLVQVRNNEIWMRVEPSILRSMPLKKGATNHYATLPTMLLPDASDSTAVSAASNVESFLQR